jgi:hypothetical protein
MDCPEDEKTYIHRVGRTARFEAPGNSKSSLSPHSLSLSSLAPSFLFIFSFLSTPFVRFAVFGSFRNRDGPNVERQQNPSESR